MSKEIEVPRVEDAALEQLLDGALSAHAVAPCPEWRTEALSYLRAIADAATLVRSLDLGDAEEPAPVYRP
ncbi:AtzG-like protein [Xanthobacter oligotrophicus]|uniref:AtzG-like protein n=1 Tax=Xanthobacter oligotrophicus TaxID=2607286 RepID=A0ABW6ZSI9_9HYPH